MSERVSPDLSLALSLALDRSHGDLLEALRLLRAIDEAARVPEAELLLLGAIRRLETMRAALP